MKANSSHAKNNLDRFLAKVFEGRLARTSFEKSGFKLLNLLFAYKRKEHGLHLRWQKQESNYLAFISIQDLAAKRKKDPLLDGIYKALLLLGDNNEEAVKQLLKTAEERIDEISSSQRAKATGPRTPNPVIQRAMQHIKRNPNYEPWEIIEFLINDVGSHNITAYDEELKTFYFVYFDKKKREREGSISLGAVRNAITKLKK